ncbi:hypothetical protein [Novosphingobium sp. PhB55]|uniref:hypothetical protein n=1 Tax=Novosphingobium sp. PhB55 TaxID=2485106 RepID=UPI001065CD07|nr:hypothetical protein [Novosphingobium sp. PhB55]
MAFRYLAGSTVKKYITHRPGHIAAGEQFGIARLSAVSEYGAQRDDRFALMERRDLAGTSTICESRAFKMDKRTGRTGS